MYNPCGTSGKDWRSLKGGDKHSEQQKRNRMLHDRIGYEIGFVASHHKTMLQQKKYEKMEK